MDWTGIEMTITRQDLEDAARAAGIEIVWSDSSQCYWQGEDSWVPATDCGDAFDLAMRCGMFIDFFGGVVCAPEIGELCFAPENVTEACEAVVLAAAEQWRAKQ
jgi:hypothetical protein